MKRKNDLSFAATVTVLALYLLAMAGCIHAVSLLGRIVEGTVFIQSSTQPKGQ